MQNSSYRASIGSIHVKAEAEKRGLDEYSATIPTLGVPLGPKQKSSQASARMCPAEGDLVSKK